ETDCPYLTPEPFRGKRNEPIYVEYVAKKIAEIKEISVEDVTKVTTENAKKLYRIG
ncbi:TatD family hydrolase, partial [Cetobacterium sp.]